MIQFFYKRRRRPARELYEGSVRSSLSFITRKRQKYIAIELRSLINMLAFLNLNSKE